MNIHLTLIVLGAMRKIGDEHDDQVAFSNRL